MRPPRSLICDDFLGKTSILFIDHFAEDIGVLAAEIAHSRGIPVIADFERMDKSDADLYLKNVDYLIVSQSFAAKLTGSENIKEMVRALSNPKRAVCVVTAGSNGCWYSEYGGEVIHYPAFKVEVMDTTGCGDVFHGSFAAALIRGESVEHAIRVATATAAIKATHLGGRAGIPDLGEVERFLSERNAD
jgi:ribokinase